MLMSEDYERAFSEGGERAVLRSQKNILARCFGQQYPRVAMRNMFYLKYL